MNHLSEEALILLHYEEGDSEDVRANRSHLATCGQCREQLESLERDLQDVDALPVPERGPDYGSEVYHRIQPSLKRRRPRLRYVGWALAAGVALAATFLAGRLSTSVVPGASEDDIRERILFVALDEHLDRSQMLLLEVANRDHGDYERAQAKELLSASRLYRQSGRGVLDASATDLLDEIERILLDVAHGSSETGLLRTRIDERDVLFKIQVLQTAVRERERQTQLRRF